MGLLDKIDINKTADSKSGMPAQNPEDFSALRAKIHMEVVEALNKHEDRQGKDMSEADTRALIDSILCQNESLPRTERSRIAQEIYDQIRGLGPLEKLMFDPTVTEIMVNGPKNIFIERKGKIIRTNVVFDDEEQLLNVIDRIVSPLGRHVDEANPMVDARLSDGSRVNAVIPPLSLKGPLLTIRRFSKVPLTVNDLIGFGSLTYKMASFLEACV
ncbi:MAG TPA: ATPase, T2SS/T4P/T4SS family, partial [Oscillospiraceae bacterium]|nr:ATPase, T2SS/T4P/T4SS family [Oscillospiraceae bacterium]